MLPTVLPDLNAQEQAFGLRGEIRLGPRAP
jgi:hypothetical protein